jgi:hypothetical protein
MPLARTPSQSTRCEFQTVLPRCIRRLLASWALRPETQRIRVSTARIGGLRHGLARPPSLCPLVGRPNLL